MARKGKLKIDFNTSALLEVSIGSKWYRVTSLSFRSFDGQRRVDTKEYIGSIYMYGTNNPVPMTNSSMIIYNIDSLPLVGENTNNMKRCLP
jgi:hypothetical protein